jgi:hypothetical protein
MKATLRSAVAIAALLVSSGLAVAAQQSPVGTTWDCLLSGSGQQGIAFLTFSNDFTFTGYQLLVGKQSAASSIGDDGRNIGGGVGRGISLDGSAPSGGGSSSTVFGFGSVSGPWDYDVKGRVVGYFVELLNQETTITTNQTVTIEVTWYTNYDYTTTPPTPLPVRTETTSTNVTYVTNSIATTNAVSFSAKVVPGKRLTLASSTPFGKVTYKGIPQKPISTPISGTWQGIKKENNQDILEFFNLLPSVVQNVYVTTNGNGPDVKFGGVSMVSVQKKMGFAFQSFTGLGTNSIPIDVEGSIVGGTPSATFGPVSYPKQGAKANTKGFEEPATPIKFQAQRQGL